jgi:hypothetical protein
MQSGYTRQYSIDDAFKVFLGGHLVSTLKYTIPEAKKILHDLQKWLAGVGIYQNSGSDRINNAGPRTAVQRYIIFIRPQSSVSGQPISFLYNIRGIIADTTVQHKAILVRQERYIETLIPPRENERAVSKALGMKMLNITAVLQLFVECLDIPNRHYSLLERG